MEPHTPKHPRLRRLFDALRPRRSGAATKGPDPARLFCQVNALFPGRFAWEYLDADLARTAAAEADER
jgi:uncharacterized protein (DUF2249 family)